VVAVAEKGSRLGRYLTALLGPPTVASGEVLGWRLKLPALFPDRRIQSEFIG
jgi:hypothetical protein